MFLWQRHTWISGSDIDNGKMRDGFSSGIVTVWASELMFYYLLYNQMAEKIHYIESKVQQLVRCIKK